jgi:hypothetical protein
MIYKGVDFNITQGIEPGIWKWSLSIDDSKIKNGQTKTKPEAVIAAWRAIDHALHTKKRPVALIGDTK